MIKIRVPNSYKLLDIGIKRIFIRGNILNMNMEVWLTDISSTFPEIMLFRQIHPNFNNRHFNS